MSNKIIKELEACNKEYEKLLDDTVDKVKPLIDGIQKTYHDNVIKNIPIDFGDYLSNALGAKVNSQRKTVINMDYCASKDYVALAKKGKVTVDEYLRKKAMEYSYWNKGEQNFTHITTGKSFGFSYYTRPKNNSVGGKLYTKTIHKSQLFYFLTQEHVDLISNKAKRKCAQEFLNFRNNYVAKLNDIGNTTLDGGIPVKVATISKVRFQNKYKTGGDGVKNYHIVEDITNDTIDKIVVGVPTVKKWDKKSLPEKRYFEYGTNKNNIVNIFVLKSVKDEDDDAKYIVYGDIHYGYDFVNAGILGAKSDNSGILYMQSYDMRDHLGKAGIIDKSKYGYSSNEYRVNDKLTLNWDEIISNKNVKSTLDDIVTFYNSAGKAIATLKQRHAGLVFINGSF